MVDFLETLYLVSCASLSLQCSVFPIHSLSGEYLHAHSPLTEQKYKSKIKYKNGGGFGNGNFVAKVKLIRRCCVYRCIYKWNVLQSFNPPSQLGKCSSKVSVIMLLIRFSLLEICHHQAVGW